MVQFYLFHRNLPRLGRADRHSAVAAADGTSAARAAADRAQLARDQRAVLQWQMLKRNKINFRSNLL